MDMFRVCKNTSVFKYLKSDDRIREPERRIRYDGYVDREVSWIEPLERRVLREAHEGAYRRMGLEVREHKRCELIYTYVRESFSIEPMSEYVLRTGLYVNEVPENMYIQFRVHPDQSGVMYMFDGNVVDPMKKTEICLKIYNFSDIERVIADRDDVFVEAALVPYIQRDSDDGDILPSLDIRDNFFKIYNRFITYILLLTLCNQKSCTRYSVERGIEFNVFQYDCRKRECKMKSCDDYMCYFSLFRCSVHTIEDCPQRKYHRDLVYEFDMLLKRYDFFGLRLYFIHNMKVFRELKCRLLRYYDCHKFCTMQSSVYPDEPESNLYVHDVM